MKALLLDPWQRRIHRIQVDHSLAAWCRILGCKSVKRLEIHRNIQGTRAVDIWVDDEGLMKEPMPPTFKVRAYPQALAGYGLVLGANLKTDESIDCPMGKDHFEVYIAWEPWEKRLKVEDYFEQLSAIHDWETHGPPRP